jgi:uncharacterized protein (TIGR04255 family)
MDAQVPKRLKREPLIEAVWELRFSGNRPAAGELLPGMVYKVLRESYAEWTRLPPADIPQPIADLDENLRYLATVRLEGNPFAVQIGAHVVALNCRRPYAGWTAFSQRIRELAAVVRETRLVAAPQRFSLKYIDLIDLDSPPSVACLNVSMAVGGHRLAEGPIQLRTELREDDLIHVLQIACPADVRSGADGPLKGVLVDIDTIMEVPGDSFWDGLSEHLDHAHERCKRLFFGLLTEDTLRRLEPEY